MPPSIAPDFDFTVHQQWLGKQLGPVPHGHGLSPAWLMLIFADGSPTRQLALITGSKFKVDIISSEHITIDDLLEEDVKDIGRPCVRREVWLENDRNDRLGHAVSWWSAADMQAFLPDHASPIGGNLAMQKLEVHRELLRVECGFCPALESALTHAPVDPGRPSLLWSRVYRMWHGGRVLTVIRETFSPGLEQWMGPARALQQATVAPEEGKDE